MTGGEAKEVSFPESCPSNCLVLDTEEEEQESAHDGLSAWEIVGIVVGSVVFAGLVVLAVFLFIKKKRANAEDTSLTESFVQHDENE